MLAWANVIGIWSRLASWWPLAEKNSVRTGCKLLSLRTLCEMTPRGPPRHLTIPCDPLPCAGFLGSIALGSRKQSLWPHKFRLGWWTGRTIPTPSAREPASGGAASLGAVAAAPALVYIVRHRLILGSQTTRIGNHFRIVIL